MADLSRHPIFDLSAPGYRPHSFHSGGRDWIESNCYVDLYIEVLHALGLNVEASLAFTLSADFEADQWTFFKPPLVELKELYGLDVQELTIWRPLHEQIATQVNRGCLVAPEVNAFYLPDVSGTDYRQNHVKTTIAVNRIDLEKKQLSYFHNAGYFELNGADFDGLFSIGKQRAAEYLPPYCELLKLQHIYKRPLAELLSIAITQARHHLAARPQANPFDSYLERFAVDLQWLVNHDLPTYHAYVFVNLRQCGANFEFAAFFVRWLAQNGHQDLAPAAEDFQKISQIAKMLILKLARMVRSKKLADLSEHVREMGQAWAQGISTLELGLGPRHG